MVEYLQESKTGVTARDVTNVRLGAAQMGRTDHIWLGYTCQDYLPARVRRSQESGVRRAQQLSTQSPFLSTLLSG